MGSARPRGRPLPPKFVTLDSGPVRVEPTVTKTLEWRDDAGSLRPQPPDGTR
jgi:hypothetical protein